MTGSCHNRTHEVDGNGEINRGNIEKCKLLRRNQDLSCEAVDGSGDIIGFTRFN